MFGNYLRHVLVLTLLAGISYSLPQVRNSMADAFSPQILNVAAASTSTSTRTIFNMFKKNPVVKQEIPYYNEQKPYNNGNIKPRNPTPVNPTQVPIVGRMLSPQEVIKILVKEGIILVENEEKAIQIIKSYAIKKPQVNSTTTIQEMEIKKMNNSNTVNTRVPYGNDGL